MSSRLRLYVLAVAVLLSEPCCFWWQRDQPIVPRPVPYKPKH